MIELVNINKKFDDKTILKNFNYRFKDSGLYVIRGKNGSGKTTLLNIISGLVNYDSGSIYYNGVNILKNDFYEIRKKELAYIFQNINLNENLNVEENLKIGYLAGNIDIKEFYKRQKEILEELDISKLRFQKVSDLSGGEKTRVTIARALIRGSNAILCDEPTSSLDPVNATNVYEILRNISKKYLIILVTHDASFLNEIENDSSLSIIDMDKKQETKEINVSKCYYTIEKLKQTHLLLRTKYFFKNYIGASISFLLLLSLILIFIGIFIQFPGQNEYSYFDEYASNNDVKIAFLSDVDTDISIPFGINGNLLGYDKHYIATEFNNDPVLRTVTTSSNSYEVFDELSYGNVNNLFKWGFFDNIIIDDTLDENEINLTSILYDYADEYGKLDENSIHLGNVQLTINDIYDIDYSNINDDSIEDDTTYYNLEYYQKGVYMDYKTYENILKFVPDDSFDYSFSESNLPGHTSFNIFNTSYSDLTSELITGDYSFSDLNNGEVMYGTTNSLAGYTLELTDETNTFSYSIICGYDSDNNALVMTYADYCDLYETTFDLDVESCTYAIDVSSSNIEKTFKNTIKYGYYMYFSGCSVFYYNYTNLSVQFSFIYHFFYVTIGLFIAGILLIILFYKKTNRKNIALLLSIGYTKKDITIQGMISNLSFILLSAPISYYTSKVIYKFIRSKIESTLDISIIPSYDINLFIIVFIIALISIEILTLLFTAMFEKNVYKKLNE